MKNKAIINRPARIAIVLLLLFFSGSVWLVFQYVAAEKQRDIDDWQARLNIMAESQQFSVEGWFEKQLENLSSLASNPLLQLYVSQVSSSDETMAGDDETRRGQLHHLRNLINATATHARVFTPINKISSNIENTVNDGIAIVNEHGRLLATRYFPVDDPAVNLAYETTIRSKSVFISPIYPASPPGASEPQPRVIIAVPVSAVQAMQADDYKAAVVAVIDPQNSLYPLLQKKWLTTHSDETLLLTIDDDAVTYRSPLKNGLGLFHVQASDNRAEARVAAQLAANIGDFVSGRDYRGVEVLAVARKLKHTAMILVQKIDVKEALSEAREHQKYVFIVFMLLLFLISISFIAIWKHASSVRLQQATRRLRARAELLNAIGDSIRDLIFLLDHNNRLVFINDALAKDFAISDVDIRGKALNHIFDSEITQRLLAVKPGAGSSSVRNREMRLEFQGRRRDYHVSVVALNHPDYHLSHLFVMHDITELKDAQGRHNRLMAGIIATLVRVIDKHDPHCAFHSERTREVAVAIARAMELPKAQTDTLAMAALLANVGKLFIPAKMLTSVEPLTSEQESSLRENTSHSVEILQDLEFDGPVIEIISQKNECLDGSGYPNGLSGDVIMLESRILAVANAFVAMTSARAYRAGKPASEVLDELMAAADSRYDRQVVAALFHVVENHTDWVHWSHVK